MLNELFAVLYAVLLLSGLADLTRQSVRVAFGRTAWLLLSAGAGVLGSTQLLLISSAGLEGDLQLTLSSFQEHGRLAAGSLVAYVLLYAGQMTLLRQRVRGVLPSGWVDGALAASFLVSFAFAFLVGPLRQHLDLPQDGAIALAARPLLDLLMTALAISSWSLSGWHADRRLPMLAAAFGVLTLSDTVGVLRLVQVLPVAWTEPLVDVGRLCALLLLARAARRPNAPATARAQERVAAAIISPGIVLLGSLSLLTADRVGWHQIGTAAFVCCVIGVVGVGVKFLVVVIEVSRLNDQRRLAQTDDLTGLRNRRGLHGALDTALQTGRPTSLLLLDLDAFKDVNDRFGHLRGDDLLRTVADRLQDHVARAHATRAVVSRLGGDEFAVLLPDLDEQQAVQIADGLAQAVAAPVAWGSRSLRIGTSIGVTTASQPALDRAADAQPPDAGELLRRADVAMYRAKAGLTSVQVFDAVYDVEAQERALLLDELRAELAHVPDVCGQAPTGGPGAAGTDLVAYYQPQVDTSTGRTTGVEALVRWHHPRLGVLAPFAFLDLAEQHGLMPAVTTTVLYQAASYAARSRAAGRPLRMSVNLSASCLTNTRLPGLVEQVLADTRLPAGALTLEVTETTLMSDPAAALDVLRALRNQGLGISIDDYGTGYSSLAYLNDLPATELKIDRSFTSRLIHDERTAAIVAATISMSADLGLRTVAEGVEDDATVRALGVLGCTETQGYHHARPMPAHDLDAWLTHRDALVPTR